MQQLPLRVAVAAVCAAQGLVFLGVLVWLLRSRIALPRGLGAATFVPGAVYAFAAIGTTLITINGVATRAGYMLCGATLSVSAAAFWLPALRRVINVADAAARFGRPVIVTNGSVATEPKHWSSVFLLATRRRAATNAVFAAWTTIAVVFASVAVATDERRFFSLWLLGEVAIVILVASSFLIGCWVIERTAATRYRGAAADACSGVAGAACTVPRGEDATHMLNAAMSRLRRTRLFVLLVLLFYLATSATLISQLGDRRSFAGSETWRGAHIFVQPVLGFLQLHHALLPLLSRARVAPSTQPPLSRGRDLTAIVPALSVQSASAAPPPV